MHLETRDDSFRISGTAYIDDRKEDFVFYGIYANDTVHISGLSWGYVKHIHLLNPSCNINSIGPSFEEFDLTIPNHQNFLELDFTDFNKAIGLEATKNLVIDKTTNYEE